MARYNSEEQRAVNKLGEGVQSYFDRYKAHPDALANLEQLLNSDANIQKVDALTPYDKCMARLDLADEFQQLRRQQNPVWQFTAAKFSAFLLAPEYTIKYQMTIDHDGQILDDTLDGLGSATRHFLLSEMKDKKANTEGFSSGLVKETAPYSPQAGPSTPTKRVHGLESDEFLSPKRPKTESSLASGSRAPRSPSGRKSRNRTESDKCKARDSFSCIITKGDDPEACHIIPFTWNETEEHRRKTTDHITRLRDMVEIESVLVRPLHEGLGGSDKAWNMLSLDPRLHTYWGKAYFGIRRIGQLEDKAAPFDSVTSVQLQFIWLPRRVSAKDAKGKAIAHADDLVDIDRERLLLETSGQRPKVNYKHNSIVLSATATDTHIPVGKRAFHVETTAQIYSGQVFEVKMPTPQVQRFNIMIDLQWSMICMAAISGAAEAIENGWDDSEGPDGIEQYLMEPIEPETMSVLGSSEGDRLDTESEWESEGD